jgi:hypothetical protein
LSRDDLADLLCRRYWTARRMREYCRAKFEERTAERRSRGPGTTYGGPVHQAARRYRELEKDWETEMIRAGGVASQHRVELAGSRWETAGLTVTRDEVWDKASARRPAG